MARKTKLRASFYHDAQFLLRLGNAIERDASLPPEWRSKVGIMLKQITSELLTAPPRVPSDT